MTKVMTFMLDMLTVFGGAAILAMMIMNFV